VSASPNVLKNQGVLGIVLGLLSSSLYGITPIFVYHAFDYGADPFGLMTSRYIIATIVLFTIRTVRFGRTKWPTPKTSIQLFLLGAIGLYANSVCMFNALKYLPSGLSMVIFYFYPVVVVLFGWALFKHKPPTIIWPCLATTIIGVILSASDVTGGQMKGLIFIVVGAFAWAFYSVLAGAVMPRAELTTGLMLVFAGAGFSFSFIWLLNPPGLPTTMPYVADVWLPALEIGLVGTIGAMGIYFAGMNRIGASKSAVIQTWEVLVAGLTGMFFLNQQFTLRQVVGGALILGGVLLLTRAEIKRGENLLQSAHA
jgi:drug/metabolite transporter (DMT)-like permease